LLLKAKTAFYTVSQKNVPPLKQHSTFTPKTCIYHFTAQRKGYIRHTKKNSIRHVCQIYIRRTGGTSLFALLLGDRNILSTAYALFSTVTSGAGIAFDVTDKQLM